MDGYSASTDSISVICILHPGLARFCWISDTYFNYMKEQLEKATQDFPPGKVKVT